MAQTDIRVLLVDDEEELIEYLSKRLLREGFTVRAVTSGERAVAAVDGEDFDVALVDLRMPGIDGIETQRLMKERRPHLQIVVLTGHGTLESALQSGQQDAFRFLQKPVDHDELVGAILEAAERKQEQQLAAFQAEMSDIVTAGGTARDIVAAVEALRRKYGIR